MISHVNIRCLIDVQLARVQFMLGDWSTSQKRVCDYSRYQVSMRARACGGYCKITDMRRPINRHIKIRRQQSDKPKSDPPKNKTNTHATPFNMSAAWKALPWLTKSRSRKLGLRLPARGAQLYALFRILRWVRMEWENKGRKRVRTRRRRWWLWRLRDRWWRFQGSLDWESDWSCTSGPRWRVDQRCDWQSKGRKSSYSRRAFPRSMRTKSSS